MIKVLFFARLKDEIGKESLELGSDYAGKSIQEIRDELIAQGISPLKDKSIRCARNQSFCGSQETASDGDEIAFMPPVTGG